MLGKESWRKKLALPHSEKSILRAVSKKRCGAQFATWVIPERGGENLEGRCRSITRSMPNMLPDRMIVTQDTIAFWSISNLPVQGPEGGKDYSSFREAAVEVFRHAGGRDRVL